MFRSKSLQGLLFVLLGCLAPFSAADSKCRVSSVDLCLPSTDVNQLPPQSNLSAYCPAAAALAYTATVCLDNCNFTTTDDIENFISGFQYTCSATPGCKDIGRSYTTFMKCFDQNGGLGSVMDDLIKAFNSKQRTDTLCRTLAQGKNCQRSAVASCDYLADLFDQSYQLFDHFSISQHICGSENVPNANVDSNCADRNDMVASIQKECNVACSISSTPDINTICLLLQDQVDCILSRSKGCTAVERQFLQPRLNTYALVNMLLNCPTQIQVRGVNVQPAGLSPDYPEDYKCKYFQQINECFNLGLTDPVREDVIIKLINGQFLIDYFCDLKDKQKLYWDQLTTNCAYSYLRCRLPLTEMYDRPTTYDNRYNISLGPFLLDVWGLNTVLSTLVCPNPPPPVLCPRAAVTVDPSSLRPTSTFTKRPTPGVKKNTPDLHTTTSTVKSIRPTPKNGK